jgi:heterodisulfide reductase subunit B
MEIIKTAYYPGCSLEGSSSAYAISMKQVFSAMGVHIPELKDWSCCGATSAHAVDHELYLGLNLRNLSLAEEHGFTEVLAPCAACYHRLAGANFEFNQSPELLAKLNKDTGLNYKGNIKVRNILDLLVNVAGLSKIASFVAKQMSGLKVACYYGCLNTRIPRMESFDMVEYPMTMDRIVESLGAEALTWSYKTECCGASLFISAEDVSAKLCSKIIKNAEACGADCIVAACPMCQNNLDTKQEEIRARFGIERPIPVLFITQLMGLAFGIKESNLALKQNFVPLGAIH